MLKEGERKKERKKEGRKQDKRKKSRIISETNLKRSPKWTWIGISKNQAAIFKQSSKIPLIDNSLTNDDNHTTSYPV